MNGIDANSEPALRFGVFALVLCILFIMELINPRRKLHYSKNKRWLTNFALSLSNALVVSLLLPIVGMGAAVLAQNNGWGIFNIVNVPAWISIPLYLLLFDLTIYFQHRVFHAIRPLWKLHRMHHADLDYDVSTGIRFHPVSIVISSLVKLVLIFLLGPVAVAVLIADVLLNATSMFNHSNWKLPERFDAVLRLIVVTPDVHRVHHSVNPGEYSHNFGFNFPWWDRIFGTYQAQPAMGHEAMEIGISELHDNQSIEFFPLLAQPFRKD